MAQQKPEKETTWQCKFCGFEYSQTLEIDEYLTRMWCPNCNKLMKRLKTNSETGRERV